MTEKFKVSNKEFDRIQGRISVLNKISMRIILRVLILTGGLTYLFSRPIISGGFSWVQVLIGAGVSLFIFGPSFVQVFLDIKSLTENLNEEGVKKVSGKVVKMKEVTLMGIKEQAIQIGKTKYTCEEYDDVNLNDNIIFYTGKSNYVLQIIPKT